MSGTQSHHLVEIWKTLASDTKEWQPLLRAAADCDPANVAELSRLRALAPPEFVNVALELSTARAKAACNDKFPPAIASRIIADIPGIEMASSRLAADYKADGFAQILNDSNENEPSIVYDLCCGIGADAMSLADRGFHIIAYDHNPLRAWMTERNAHCESRSTDVTTLNLEDIRYFHLDPSRRSESRNNNQAGQRHWRFEDYKPGPDFINQLINKPNRAGAVKLGPGINLAGFPIEQQHSSIAFELEFISEPPDHRLTQAILWTGCFASASTATVSQRISRRATILPSRETLTSQGNLNNFDQPPIAEKLNRFLYTINPAVERAELLNELCDETSLPLIHPKLGLLTGDQLVKDNQSPWIIATFELLEELPYREQKIKRWINEHHAGIVEIKTRDKIVNPDHLQKQFRGKGDNPFTLFILRFDDKIRTLITRRIMTTSARYS